LALVELGEMTPDEAENWAAHEGIPPIAGRPDPSIFDPMTQRSWTPLQVVAWIAYLDADKVRDASNEFRDEWYTWREVAESDIELVQSKKVARLEYVPDPSFFELVAEDAAAMRAANELLTRLLSGDVSAAGLPLGPVTASGLMGCVGSRGDVPAVKWHDLQFDPDNADVALLPWWQSVTMATMGYCDLLIERERVLKLWPGSINSSSVSAKRGFTHPPRLEEAETRAAIEAAPRIVEQPVGELAGEDGGASYRTGAPGRPSAIQHVEREAERRRNEGEALTPIAAEAEELRKWCATTHPAAPTPSSKTIENRIRRSHSVWKASSRKPPHN
jgi:hypothetical protein